MAMKAITVKMARITHYMGELLEEWCRTQDNGPGLL
jgi:hypothetical protein